MGHKEYRKTKGMYYILDPIAGDYYQGKENGMERYTKDLWNAKVYKVLGMAFAAMDNLGTGYVVVDANGKKYER